MLYERAALPDLVSWLDRRTFLVRTGLGMAAAALARAEAPPLLAQSLADDWVAVRGLFNLRTPKGVIQPAA